MIYRTHPMPFPPSAVRVMRATPADAEAALAIAEGIALAYIGRWNAAHLARATWQGDGGDLHWALSLRGAVMWHGRFDGASFISWWEAPF